MNDEHCTKTQWTPDLITLNLLWNEWKHLPRLWADIVLKVVGSNVLVPNAVSTTLLLLRYVEIWWWKTISQLPQSVISVVGVVVTSFEKGQREWEREERGREKGIQTQIKSTTDTLWMFAILNGNALRVCSVWIVCCVCESWNDKRNIILSTFYLVTGVRSLCYSQRGEVNCVCACPNLFHSHSHQKWHWCLLFIL